MAVKRVRNAAIAWPLLAVVGFAFLVVFSDPFPATVGGWLMRAAAAGIAAIPAAVLIIVVIPPDEWDSALL